MTDYSKLFKRAQAMVLVVAIMLSVLNVPFWPAVFADGEGKTQVDKTFGEIVAENYELTDAEKNLLKSGYLVEDVITYTKPDGSDGLIAVDTDNNTVTAKAYKSGNYTWTPVSAAIVVSNEVKEELTLSGTDTYTATYVYDGNAFSVKVDYEVTVTIDEETQSLLLNAPADLKQSIDKLDTLTGVDAKLCLIAQAVPSLVEFAEGIEITVTLWGQQHQGSVTFAGDEAKEAVAVLNEQYTANGELLALSVLAKEYANAYKTQFLGEKGAEMLEELNTLRELVRVIYTDKVWENEIMMDGLASTQPQTYNLLNALLTTMQEWLEVADAVAADPWTSASADYVADDVDYAALDILVAGIADPVGPSVAIKNPLTVDTTTVQFNMSMWDVTVKVVLQTVDKVTGSTALITTKSATTTLTFADGTAKSEIEALANAFASGEAANWGADYVADKFDVSYSALPEALTEDTEYVITYSPKNYDVTLSYADTMHVPYGFRYELPAAAEEGVDYDYYVDGVYYAEGTVIVITDNTTIDRNLGKAYTTAATNRIVADRYFASNAKASAILTSGALTVGNETIAVRYPDAGDGLVKINGNTLTASDYDASYNGLVWEPYTYTVVNGTEETLHYFNGANEVTITESAYDRVDVVYQLALGVDVLDLVNLPDVLADEAEAQKKALDSISTDNILSYMEMLNGSMLAGLGAMINATKLNDDPAKDAELKASFTAIVADITNNCVDASTGNLKIYDMLKAYTGNNGGLAYYYRNSEAMINEIELLSEALSKMVAGEDEKGALANLLGAVGQGDKVDRIESLESSMTSVKNALTAPNAAIDVNSSNLDKLVAALTMEGATESYDSLPEAFVLESGEIAITADNKTTISDVVVSIDGGASVKVPSKTYDRGYVLSAADIQAWVEAIDNAIAALGVSDDFYSNDYDSSVLTALEGKTVEELAEVLKTLDLTWSAKEFTVHIEGTSDQTISVNDLAVELPASPNSTYRYDYIINGAVYTEKYTFTKDEVLALFVNGEYTIQLVKVNVAREQLVNLVDTLNSGADSSIVFALVENGDKYSIVMKVNAADTGALMGSVQSVAMGFVNSGYMVDLDNEKLVYINDNNELKVSLQAVVDAVMNSGFGIDTILSVMDANGTINNMTLDGSVISAEAIGALGGKLVATSMQLTKGTNSFDLPFYITLGSAPAALTTLRNALADQIGNYVDVICTNGSANVALTLPGKAYEAYLAVLLATDNIDLSDIDAVNAEIAIGFVKDVIDPLLQGDVTTTTLKNTLAKLGYNLDLTAYEAYFNYFKNFYNGCEFTYDTDSLSASGVIDIKGLVDRLNLGTLGTMIAEYETGLTVSADFVLTNVETTGDYEAIYVDVYASGITNKAGITKDLAAKLSTMAGTALVVLTDNVDGDLTFNTTTVLNLNGFTVSGDITANGSLTIIDTAAEKDVCGGVNGEVSGNVTILAGRYTDDVTAFVKNGYAVTDGLVGNIFYDIVKEGDVITVEIDAGILNIESMPGLRELAIDMLADLAFNGYTTNSLYVDGNKVYDITVDDLLGIYAGTDRVDTAVSKLVEMFDVTQLDDVINGIVAALTNFAAIETSIPAGTPIYTAALTVGAWAVEVEHILDGDYITANLAATKAENEKTLHLVIGGSEEDKAALAALAGELAAVTEEIKVELEMTQGFAAADNKNFVINATGTAVVTLDLTAPEYAIALSVLLADGIGGSAADALVAGIEAYYATGSMETLEAAFNALTTAQVISAVKNLQKTDVFTDAIASLGLTETVADDVIALEATYDAVAKLAAAALRRISVTGGSRTLGSFLREDGTYVADVENIARAYSREIARGYSLTLDAVASTVSITIKLFGEEEIPEIKAPAIYEPSLAEDEKINEVKVDTEKKWIVLDLDPNGITAAELKALLTFRADADEVTIAIGAADDALVTTGTLIQGTATRKGIDEIASVEYLVIVLGDVDADGRVTNDDVRHLTGLLTDGGLVEDEIAAAADLNGNAKVDIGDAYLINKKETEDNEDLPNA